MLAQKLVLLSATLVCALLIGAGAAQAAFVPDTSFGSGGSVRMVLGTDDDDLVDSEVQGDGKIVSCGSAELLLVPSVVITRVNPDGSPDDSFSGDGRQYLAFGGNSGACNGVEIDSSGFIYVGSRGNGTGLSQVARLDTAGELDTTYGTGGYGTWNNATGIVMAIDLGPGNKIVGAGFSGSQFISDIYVARLTAGGVPDILFNATGSRTVSYGVYEDRALAVIAGADNKITIAGLVNKDVVSPALPDAPHWMIGRFTNTGGLDGSFGIETGRTILRYGVYSDVLNALQVLPDGSVIAAGAAIMPATTGGLTGLIVRVGPSGIPDASFGAGGFTTFNNAGGQDYLQGLTTDPQGRLVAAGYGADGRAILFRFNSSGAPDASFAPAGVLRFGSSLAADFAKAATVDGAGRLIATGSANNSEDSDSMLYALKAEPEAPPANPPPSVPEPIAKITTPKAGSSTKLTKISGTASGGAITRVRLAIERVDSKLLKKKKRCVFIKSAKRSTKTVKVKTTKTCGVGVTINAKGTSSWSLKFSKSLRAGQYRITAIAVASNGAKTTTFSKSRGNQVLLRVKKPKRR